LGIGGLSKRGGREQDKEDDEPHRDLQDRVCSLYYTLFLGMPRSSSLLSDLNWQGKILEFALKLHGHLKEHHNDRKRSS